MPPETSLAERASSASAAGSSEGGLSGGMTMVFALACGLVVANLYYAQPLIGLIGPDVGMSLRLAGLLVTLTQLGYGAGLVLLVPLADLVENRRLICLTLSGMVVGLIGAAVAPNAGAFLAASLVIGLGAVGAQILVPFAANLATEATRGRVVGNVMAGLLAGIMLARPVSSFVSHQFGWRAIFGVSAAVMLVLVALLRWRLPRRQPGGQISYGGILASLWPLVRDYPPLRRRGFYQAMLFMTFSMFWTGVPLVLSGSLFGLSQNGIAVFALAGAGGALSAPLAGRMADRGWTTPVTGVSIAAVIGAMLLAGWAGGAGALVALAVAAVVADAFIQISLVMSQRVIYGLNPAARGRLNGVFVAFMFVFGAAGSALASITYDIGGWHLTALTAAIPAVLALVAYGTELVGVRGSSSR